MVLTKRQKVMVAVLGLGAVCLAGDKLFLDGGSTGPSQAEAASGGGAVPLEPKLAPAVATPPGNSLTERLDALRETMNLNLMATKDAFCPSGSWLSDLRPGERTAMSSDEVRVMAFGRRHALNAIVTSDCGGTAFIDDTFVRVGQVIDGFRLVRLGYRTAVFEANGLEVVLRLKGPGRER